MNSKIDINYLLENVEAVAQSVLNRTFKGVITYPVDLTKIASDFHIPVYIETLKYDLAGCFIAEAGKSAIYLNKADASVRQRFTLAHELGHFVSYKFQEKVGAIFDERSTLASLGTDPEEKFANKFAAEILMPREEFREQMKHNHDKIDDVAKYFNVSKSAIEIRVKTTMGF